VLERLSKGIVLPLFDYDADMLEDAIIENRQAIDMATIYRDILSSISETYGTVINNNLNYAMKFLAGATIVLSIPTIISSFMGMNVPFGSIGTNDHSAAVLLLGSILASLLVALWLRKKGLL
jgi:magnesium transporter